MTKEERLQARIDILSQENIELQKELYVLKTQYEELLKTSRSSQPDGTKLVFRD